MRCPVCKSEHLVRSERSGVETDYCPQCRVWLDRESLQKETKERMQNQGQTGSVTDTRPPLPPDRDDQQ